MKEKIKRVTLSKSTFEEIQFSTKASKFLVKNFSEGDIYVSFDANAKEENAIKIPSQFFQVVIINENMNNYYSRDKIYVKGNGEVEVQAIWY